MPDAPLSLREHLAALLAEMDKRYQQRFDDQTRAIDAAFAASKEAVAKAEAATERRLEGMNEFRDALQDRETRFVNVDQHEAMREILNGVVARLDRIEGKSSGISSSWGIVVAIIGLIGIVVAIYANTR
jgi:hypothetical protein